MRAPQGLKAWLTEEPWRDSYDLRLVHDHGAGLFVAARVEDGRIVYEEVPEGAKVEPFLRLGASEVDSILGALKQNARPEDATLDALRDSRETRDRLLAMIEKRGLR